MRRNWEPYHFNRNTTIPATNISNIKSRIRSPHLELSPLIINPFCLKIDYSPLPNCPITLNPKGPVSINWTIIWINIKNNCKLQSWRRIRLMNYCYPDPWSSLNMCYIERKTIINKMIQPSLLKIRVKRNSNRIDWYLVFSINKALNTSILNLTRNRVNKKYISYKPYKTKTSNCKMRISMTLLPNLFYSNSNNNSNKLFKFLLSRKFKLKCQKKTKIYSQIYSINTQWNNSTWQLLSFNPAIGNTLKLSSRFNHSKLLNWLPSICRNQSLSLK